MKRARLEDEIMSLNGKKNFGSSNDRNRLSTIGFIIGRSITVE